MFTQRTESSHVFRIIKNDIVIARYTIEIDCTAYSYYIALPRILDFVMITVH